MKKERRWTSMRTGEPTYLDLSYNPRQNQLKVAGNMDENDILSNVGKKGIKEYIDGIMNEIHHKEEKGQRLKINGTGSAWNSDILQRYVNESLE